MGLRDSFAAETPPTGHEVEVRVRLDDRSGELIITEWRGNERLTERRETPREY